MARTCSSLLIVACVLSLSSVNAQYFLTNSAGHTPAHQSYCASQGGQLATIKSQADQDAVFQFAQQQTQLGQSSTDLLRNHFHVGLVKCEHQSQINSLDCSGSNVYSWVDGTPLDGASFDHWYPQSNQAAGSGEDWIVIKLSENNGEWMQASGSYYGICEVPTDPAVIGCTETESAPCHELAFCESGDCVCPMGIIGDGQSCSTTGWTARISIDVGDISIPEECDTGYTTCGCGCDWNTDCSCDQICAGAPGSVCHYVPDDIAATPAVADYMINNRLSVANTVFNLAASSDDANSMSYYIKTVRENNVEKTMLTLNAVFSTEDAAEDAMNYANGLSDTTVVMPGVTMGDKQIECRVYAYQAPTTSGPQQVMPAGLEVTNVYFDTACANTGCWVIDFQFTTSTNAFNTLYIPRTAGNDALSYDLDYTAVEDATLNAANFPCSPDTTHTAASASTVWKTSTCCIKQAVSEYRTLAAFDTWENGIQCGDVVERPGYDGSYQVAFPEQFYEGFLTGDMSGMTASTCWIEFGTTVDPFIGQYTATLKCDEVEMRKYAGFLKGTPGVEHTIDTFIGIANFKPTGLDVLDSFASQTAIHLEKTSFFSVSTHGTNDYTFLEYVNLRLVAIYLQDADFSETTDEFADRTTRTNPTDAAHYVQVTFTLGSQYQPNANTGIVPLDSVRVGHGAFFSESGVQQHACAQWDPSFATDTFDRRALFVSRLGQTACAPGATMCSNPSSIPDQFVSFNVPLGIDWLPDETEDLSENVFVSMVISAIDTTTYATAPNMGGEAKQMKTTLTASIPVVEGGINIFCDGFVAKTDLEDVANVDLILGSASTPAELSRLTIFENIANSGLDRTDSQVIDTDSIESGLMTLVVKGNDDYFNSNSGTAAYSLELEDAITVHIMEDGTAKFDFVEGLIEEYPDDNDGDVDGYYLNGAFRFTVNRQENRAHLEPTSELLAECPFAPAPPSGNNAVRETCVVRRDVRLRAFPHRPGGWSTAMEIAVVDYTGDEEARFFQTMLGSSNYARQLGRDFAGVVAAEYSLNGRYKRAWWINPAYEWTPAQTQGESIFTLSQKIFMFALINLNERYNDVYADGCYNLPDSIKLGNKCFFSPGGTYNWADSRLQCQQYGGDLAIINSREEDLLAQQMMTDGEMGNCWIGADDIASEGTWKWLDGSSVSSGKTHNGPYGTYSNWNTGEPNNVGTSGEDCLHIWAGTSDSWNDLPCSDVHNFVCSVVDNGIEKPQLHLPPLPARRMLLSSTPSKETGAGVSAMKLESKTSRKTMMANVFGVPEDKVATFSLTMAISDEQACLPLPELQASLRGNLEEQLAEYTSPFETLQVLSLNLHREGITCPSDSPGTRRSQRVLLSTGASVDVEMLVVFSKGMNAVIDLDQIKQLPGITEFEKLSVSEKVELAQPEKTEQEEKEEEAAAAKDSKDESSGNSTGLIVGVAAGVGGALLLAGAAFLVVRKRAQEAQPQEVVSAVSITDLKAQLSSDV